MKRKLMLFLSGFLLLVPAVAFAQTGMVMGAITDQSSGDPIPGASVQIRALNRGALSNVDGRYVLRDVPVGTQTVEVSQLGYATVQKSVTVTPGEPTIVNFQLSVEALQLDRIVVTGQQIERQKRSLGYSVSTVSGEKVNEVQQTNFVNALQGRAPGVQVTSQSGDIGASTRIVIRGVSSLSGDNQPLFVVDGVPISNANIVAGTSESRLNGAIDVGNRASDLNPEDIASITVLRGGAAAALYGQRAKDGVILIQTKKGRAVGGQTITVSSTVQSASPLVMPSFQNSYAQGNRGVYQNTSLNGWGPAIAGQHVTDLHGDSTVLNAYPNNVRDFYDTGLLTVNSVSLSSAGENGDFRLGVTHQNQQGLVPNSNLKRTSVNLNSGYNLQPNLQARLSGTYVTTHTLGKAVAGGNDPNVLTSLVNGLPRTFDMNQLKNYKDANGDQISLDNFTNNPYWIVNENPFADGIDRLIGSGEVHYSPVEWITLTGRAGLDRYTESRQNQNAKGTIGRMAGLFSLDVIQSQQQNYDLQAEVRRNLTEDLTLTSVLGYNYNDRTLQIQRNEANELTVAGLYNFANALSNSPANSFSHRRLFGAYVDATLGYREYLFLEATGRNDWSSTLPKNNRSFFYPSVSLSFIPTAAFDIAGDILSYVKLRANYAQVGSDEDPYQLNFLFNPVSGIFGQYGTGNNFPFGGQTGFNATNTIPPTNLKPQRQTTYELGGEFDFFNGRAGIDLTWYDIRTADQIISIPIPQSTGFGANRTNVGEVSNKGIEATLDLTPVRTRLINWAMNVNYTQNKNKVVSLAPGLESLIVASGYNGLQVKAVPGQSFGLYGPGFLTVTDSSSQYFGMPIIDPATGLRQSGDIVRLGGIDPKFQVSLSNTVSLGDVSLSALVTWREGGTLYSETVRSLRVQGLAKETAVNRGGTFIDEGVIPDGSGGYKPNDVPTQSMQAWWQSYDNANYYGGAMFDASNARLSQLSLDWNVPRKWLTKTPFGSLQIGLQGNNLWLFYKKVPHIDPETGLFGSASNGQGIEFNQLPSVRSFGLNIRARF